MKEQCGICAYWEYKGERDEYEENEGHCWKILQRTKCDERCDEYVIHPMILEEE